MINANKHNGFTLVEIIISIVIIGIVSSVVGLIVGKYIDNYDATSRRTMMQTSAQYAIERISREIRHALPNSVCVPNLAGTSCTPTTRNKVAFIKVKDAGYYQDVDGIYPDGTTLHKALSLSPPVASTQFDIISGVDLRVLQNDYVSIYNINNSSIYTGNNIARITAVPTTHNVDGIAGDDITTLTIESTVFPLNSPQRRVHIIESNSTIFYLNGTNLMLGKSRRFDHASFNPTTPEPGKEYLLLKNVDSLSFNFDSGSSQRAGLLHIDLVVKDEGEQIHLIHEAHVYNVP